MPRQERIQVTLTELELDWLRWWAAQVGRTPSAAAARLLSERIDEVSNRPSNLLAFKEDHAREALPPEVAEDLVRAYLTPGVAQALAGDAMCSDHWALQAARYLEDLSLWLEQRGAGGQPAPLLRLADTPAPAARRRFVERALFLATHDRALVAAIGPHRGTPQLSEKGQLSDTVEGPVQRDAAEVRTAGSRRV